MVFPPGKQLVLRCDNCFVVKSQQLFGVVPSWPSHSIHGLVKIFEVIRVNCFFQPPFIFEFPASLSEKLTQYSISGPRKLVLLSMLFLARFLFMITSSSSILFHASLQQCRSFFFFFFFFFFDNLYKIGLKAFHFFFSTVSVGISVSLSFNEACGPSFTLLIL